MPFIRIYNRSNFLLGEIPSYHPASLKYIKYWKEMKRRCIEGYWAQDTKDPEETGMWRWMPGHLFFYVNFGTILHRPKDLPKTVPKKKVKPDLTDLEWELFYNFTEARGFSGFENDLVYTCLREVKEIEQGNLDHDATKLHESVYKSDGSLKKYKPAREYLRALYPEPMGKALFYNTAKNMMLLGARGGGKSYSIGVGIALPEMLFDGAREYNKEYIENPYKNEIFVGAAISGKSSSLLAKTSLAKQELPGAYSRGTPDEIPSPIDKTMTGSLQPNNEKKPWSNIYDKKIAGKWTKAGSGSMIVHGIITTENPEVAAGGRYSIILIEEVGLCPNILTVHGSNDAAQMADGTEKYGSSIYIGTSGNMEKILESEIIFRDPEGFDMLEFEDEWEGTGKICWFVPAYYMDRTFKDEEGNTKVEEALAHYEKRREVKKKATSRKPLELEMMNYPIKPSEMFLNVGNNVFPVSDLKHRYASLMADKDLLGSSWKGEFEITSDGNPKWVNTVASPIREFPFKGNDDMSGCVEIFEPPIRDNEGKVPFGIYIAGCDPVDDDGNEDITQSLQSTFVLNLLTDRIVAEYTARTRRTKQYFEQQRRLLLYYNARMNYENQKKGLFAHYENKNSIHLLVDTPEILKDRDLTKKMGGVGNTSKGTWANEYINKWGLELQATWMEAQAQKRESGVTNVYTLRTPAYMRECILYNGKLNTDRVSSMNMLMILREQLVKYTESKRNNRDTKNEFTSQLDKMYDKYRKKQLIKTYY
jgi:hypothetical protein